MKYLVLIGALFSLTYLVSCTSDDDGTTVAYNGPGSQWTMVRSGDTYTLNMVEGSDTMTIVATGSSISTGHTKLTVSSASATGSATAPNPGDIAHALEVPGTAFLLLPVDPGAETIAMVTSGSCPTSNFEANWIIGERAASAGSKITDNASDWYGSISWDTSTGQATFPLQRSVESNAAAPGESSVQAIGTCSLGRVSNSGSGVEAYFTTSGMAIVATNFGLADQSHIVGVPKAAIGTASGLHGNYFGFLFDQENSSTFAITAAFGVGTGTAGDIVFQIKTGNDLDTNGTTYTAEFNTGNVDSPGDGFMTGAFDSCTGGSVTNFDSNCELACAVAQNVNSSGKNFIYCVGQHPADEDDRITALLVSE